MAEVNFRNFISIVLVTAFCLSSIYQVNSMECGRVNVTKPLIRGGNVTHRGEWPFIVALYEVSPSKYICGGTLISDRHVLTAAHCVHRRHSPIKLTGKDVEVRLGAYNLTIEKEVGVLQRNVTEIFVNPDWNPYSDSYDGDLAILLLSDNVSFSNFIQPICVPANDVVIDGAIVNVNGTVVGWGLAENEFHSEVPRKAEAKAINSSLCYRMDPAIISSSSYRSFCAEGVDGTPNKGDSGGGFFVVSKATWVQYGIISALRTNETGHAVSNSFSIYTNVKSFKRWIVEKVKETGGEVGESTMRVILNCDYGFSKYGFVGYGYTCKFDELEIRSEHNEVVSVTGDHDINKQNDNVESIHFRKGFMFTLPVGLGKFFKNVKILVIHSSLGLKHIWRAVFRNFDKVEDFVLSDNDIERIDEDCFWDLLNLKSFRFNNNNLKEIPEKIFDENEKLVQIILNDNKLEYLPNNLFRRNLLLKVIDLNNNNIKSIGEQIFETNSNLIQVDLSSNQLPDLPINLFRNNSLLKYLLLVRNNLRSIDENIFEANTKLSKVTLSSNQLEYLNRNLFKNNVLLETLLLNKNSLSTIDEHIFEKNAKLMSIDLSDNKLEHLPTNLFKNNLHLQHVILTNNLITALDERFFEANVLLSIVFLSGNQLEYLPRHLFENNLVLQICELGKNNLKEMDEQIFESNRYISTVILSLNQLNSLPKDLFKNNLRLDVIEIVENSIATLPEQLFETNTKLRLVILDSNKLETLPPKLFHNNLLIEAVNISHNFLRTIDENIFETNEKLKQIILHSNQLESLPRNLFKNNLLLKLIDLRHNLLKTIDERMFETNVKLEILYLGSNKLEYLPRYLFKTNRSLQVVDFLNNKLITVAIDFKELKNINLIVFHGNLCINAMYNNVIDDSHIYINHYRNLTEFQSILSTSCRFLQ